MKWQIIFMLLVGTLILSEGSPLKRDDIASSSEEDDDDDEAVQNKRDDSVSSSEEDDDDDEAVQNKRDDSVSSSEEDDDDDEAVQNKRDDSVSSSEEDDDDDEAVQNKRDGNLSSSEEDDDYSDEYEDVPDDFKIAYCRHSYTEVMETRDLTKELPEIKIFTVPAGIGNPQDVRIDQSGWKAPVPAQGENGPSIVLNFTTRVTDSPPFVQQLIINANAMTAIQIQSVGAAGFETVQGGKWFEGVGRFDPPLKPQMLKFTMGEPFVDAETEYNLKLAVYACYPDQIIDISLED